MAQPQYGYGQQSQPYGGQNLNFYQSSFSGQPVSGTTTPFQAYSGGVQSNTYPGTGFGTGFNQPGVSGRMGESGGLRTGWYVHSIHTRLKNRNSHPTTGSPHSVQKVMKVNHLYSKS